MNSARTFELIRKTGIIAIVRGDSGWPIDKIAQALYDGGIRAIEVSLTTPNGLEMIRRLRELAQDGMQIGAGTVLDPEMASAAIRAGAEFILSPTCSPDVIALCNRYSVLAVPGVFTPTEVLNAWELGVQVVKIFPAGGVGPGYIKDLKGPLPQIDVIPVGGVNLYNTCEFIRAGACGVGVGGELVDKKAVTSGDFQALTAKASQFIQEVRRGRE